MADIRPEVLKTLRSDAVLQKINQGKRRTHTFNVDFKEFNEKFVGKFTVHHPSNMERLNIGVIKSQLLGGVVPIDVMTDNIAQIVATLDSVLDEKPDWFDPFDDELDYEVLEAIYKEYVGWINSFRERAKSSDNRPDSTDGKSEV